MKKYIILAAVAALGLSACNEADKFEYGKNVIMVTGAEATPISKDRILADAVPITYNFTVSATDIAPEDIKVHLYIDSLAVEQYNQLNGTSFVSVPRNTVILNDEYTVIKAGTAASANASVTLLDNSFIEEGVNYVIPISAVYTEGGNYEILEGSSPCSSSWARPWKPIPWTSAPPAFTAPTSWVTAMSWTTGPWKSRPSPTI